MKVSPTIGVCLAGLLALSACGDSASPIGIRDFETSRRSLDPIEVDGTSYRRVEVTSTYDNGEVYVDEFVYVESRRVRCGGDCPGAVRQALRDAQSGGGGMY